MGYRYINEIGTRENIDAFLGLADLAAGGGQDASNVFELARKFTDSPPMRACEAQLRQDPQSAKLIAERHVMPPYDADSMRALPKGSLGHTYIRVLDGYGYDINFSLKRLSSTIWRPMLTTSTSACCRPTICITSSPDSASTALVSSGS